MTRHANQRSGYQSDRSRRLANIAAGLPAGEREPTGRYQLRSASGAVLAYCDKLEPLLRNIGEKPGAQILRGGVVVWPVEERR